MAVDPGLGYKVTATVIETKGSCSAGVKTGDTFELSCHNPAGLCGFFYHAIFADLQTFQFGGKLPWWEGDTIYLQCPDPVNMITLELHRTKR
ncbi:MAG: TIGR04076 family protein [Syntrophorhabdus sp.]